MSLLEVRGLRTYFFQGASPVVKAVDGIDLKVEESTVFGLAGESGSGKTMAALSLTRLLPEGARIVGGEVFFRNEDLLSQDEESLRKIRGAKIAYIFQDPVSCLNPVMPVGRQIEEALVFHRQIKRKEAREETIGILEKVRITGAGQRYAYYPHQLSGGMNQRVMIAMALSSRPSLLIADEPTTALDVSIQAQILALLERLREEFGLSLLFITHDLFLLEDFSQKMAVMYAGKILEYGVTREVFRQPLHPYTKNLLAGLPRWPDPKIRRDRGAGAQRFRLAQAGEGCCFYQRCPQATAVCPQTPPPCWGTEDHKVYCHNL